MFPQLKIINVNAISTADWFPKIIKRNGESAVVLYEFFCFVLFMLLFFLRTVTTVSFRAQGREWKVVDILMTFVFTFSQKTHAF